MATLAFNCAKGRAVELYKRVKTNDPANSALIIVALTAKPADATLVDFATLAAVLGGGATESSVMARKTLTDVELAAFPAADNTNDRYDIALPAFTYTAPAAGTAIVGFLVCYDNDTTTGTDANIEPISYFDFPFTPNGSNDCVVNAGPFWRAN